MHNYKNYSEFFSDPLFCRQIRLWPHNSDVNYMLQNAVNYKLHIAQSDLNIHNTDFCYVIEWTVYYSLAECWLLMLAVL